MLFSLERVNLDSGLFEEVSHVVFSSLVRGKVVREVSKSDGRTTIRFTDGSGIGVDDKGAKNKVTVRYMRSEAEQKRDGFM